MTDSRSTDRVSDERLAEILAWYVNWQPCAEDPGLSRMEADAISLFRELQRLRSPGGASGERIPAVLFDGYAVFKALSKDATRRTSTENVSDVLDAVVRLLRGPALDEAGRAAPEPPGDPLDYKLPCEVRLPPATTFGVGVSLRTVVHALQRRTDQYPPKFSDSPDLSAVTSPFQRPGLIGYSSGEPVAKPHGVNKADGCPVCFVPWGACQHTNPPKERT